MNIRKLTLSSLFIALGTLLGHLIVIPIGVSRCFPLQHTINVLSAVILGPIYAVSNAFIISLLRNIMGTGSLLAFPGSMIGALLAGILYSKFKKQELACIGEVIGTGIIGGLLAFPIAKYFMGSSATAFFFLIPFLVSTLGGSLIAFVILKNSSFIEIIKRSWSNV
ncbi:MAG: energy coupling factor transporter S component ThiW [Firmicutes bacterium]|jgi:energy coupling factor transporter S component ThiW|nr:energy coupling factor transporter S component ThiW [Bacillota bacterium]